MRKPFEGVRVVDFSVLTSAPLATMVLADQGADVVKVENTVVGDIYRLSAFSTHRLRRTAIVGTRRPGRSGVNRPEYGGGTRDSQTAALVLHVVVRWVASKYETC